MKFIILVAFLFVGLSAKTIKNIAENSGRIVGGIDATPGQWPFVASVHHAGSFICGGALFSVQWVITSAECVFPFAGGIPLNVYIAVGGVTHTGLEAGKVEWPLDEIHIHPQFHSKDTMYYNNIALLHCVTPVPIGNQVQPIQLPFATEVINPGAVAYFAGWGGSSDSFPVSKLQFVLNSVVMEPAACSSLMGVPITNTELCTVPSTQTTACKYDHGSPLFRFDPVYGTILLGIVNYAPCQANFMPTIFTNIPTYRNWINTITG